ncbi:MAG: CBS domain-containing protein [Firmicutes bacterium]|nr:CBS domain-containing protein [Bacillota bacterium]
MLVREKMTKDVISINISDTLAKAEKIMQQNKIHQLPVFSGKKISGILAVADIEQFKQSNEEVNWDTICVKDVLPPNQRLITISPDVSIEQAVMLFQNNQIGSLPVMEDGKLAGIITITDVLNTFVDLLWAKRSRITVELGTQPGLIADVAGVIGDFGVSILRIAMFPQPAHNSFEALISLDTDNIRPIVEKLRQKGYVVSAYNY